MNIDLLQRVRQIEWFHSIALGNGIITPGADASGHRLARIGSSCGLAQVGRREQRLMAITRYLYYQDVAGALKFLSKAFGFQKCGTQAKGPDDRINHSAMKLGDDLIMMGCPGPAYRNPKAGH